MSNNFRRIRVIPTLLLQDSGLVKTSGFRNPVYVGDPINVVRIFNEKEVDEIAILDIGAGKKGTAPQMEKIREIAAECFMPFGYGGGINSLQEIEKILRLGVEKAILNTAVFRNPSFLAEASKEFGSSTIVVSMDVKRNLFGKPFVFVAGGKVNTGLRPAEYAKRCEDSGAGEILLTSIDQEGKYKGYDLKLIQEVAGPAGIPVIANGGARSVADFAEAITEGGASAVAAGSMFVFHGKLKGVLVNFPTQDELIKELYDAVTGR